MISNQYVQIHYPSDLCQTADHGLRLLLHNFQHPGRRLLYPIHNTDDLQSCPKAPEIPWKQRFNWFKCSFRNYNASIVCLQEVDYGQEFSDYLQSIGYLTFYNATTKITPKQTRQGLLLAIKTKQFSVLKSEFVYYDQQKQNHQFVFVELEHKVTKHRLFVFSTHLKANLNEQETRLKQIQILEQYIQHVHKLNPKAAIILTGDLNTIVTLESYKKMKNIEFQQGEKFETVYPDGDWTLHKIEKEEYLTLQLDHILYKGLNVIAYEKPPALKQVGKAGLPDHSNPSDHIPLFALFTFK